MQTLVQKHHEDIVGQIDKALTNLRGISNRQGIVDLSPTKKPARDKLDQKVLALVSAVR